MNEPDWGPIGEAVYRRTYSRTRADGSKESWDDTVHRVVGGNLDLTNEREDAGEAQLLYDAIREFKFVPAGRHLWLTGVGGREFLFNCHHAGWPFRKHATFLFEMLMEGGGVGANYSPDFGAHWRVRGPVRVIVDPDDAVLHDAFVVHDSREGWVKALDYLLLCYEQGRESAVFDCSKVREAGEPLKTFGGVSAGAEPLKTLLVGVGRIVNEAVAEHGWRELGWRELMQIDHQIASCVVAGNVRRSARMSILSWQEPDAMDFLRLKRDDPDGHWSTNISLEVDDLFWEQVGKNRYASKLLDEIVDGMLANGEPGLYNSSLASIGERETIRATNPCGEIPLQPWENCNLGSVNLAKCASADEASRLFALAARFLYRATFSPDVHPQQDEILRCNRRIGVGFYGLQAWGLREYGVNYSGLAGFSTFRSHLKGWAARVEIEAHEISARLREARPIKTTTIAPTGTTSALSGDTAGISPIFSPYYLRRVRYGDGDPTLNLPHADEQLEPDRMSANTTVAAYPVRDRILDRVPVHAYADVESAGDIAPMAHFALAKCVQDNWADNGVSTTVALRGEAADPAVLRKLLEYYGPSLKGITAFAERGYPQAPMEELTLDRYASLVAAGWATSPGEITLADCIDGACPVDV